MKLSELVDDMVDIVGKASDFSGYLGCQTMGICLGDAGLFEEFGSELAGVLMGHWWNGNGHHIVDGIVRVSGLA